VKIDNSELNKEVFVSRFWRSAFRVTILFVVLVAIYSIVVAVMALRSTLNAG